MVVLHERGDAGVAVARCVKGFEKEPARIRVHVGFDEEHARKIGRPDVHQASCSRRRTRYSPYALLRIDSASFARLAAVMKPMRYAISSRHATIRPCRSSIA